MFFGLIEDLEGSCLFLRVVSDAFVFFGFRGVLQAFCLVAVFKIKLSQEVTVVNLLIWGLIFEFMGFNGCFKRFLNVSL